MPISSQALWRYKEGSETKDTTVSLQRATSRTDDDIVQPLVASPLSSTNLFIYRHLRETNSNLGSSDEVAKQDRRTRWGKPGFLTRNRGSNPLLAKLKTFPEP